MEVWELLDYLFIQVEFFDFLGEVQVIWKMEYYSE